MSDSRGVADIRAFVLDTVVAYRTLPPLDADRVREWLGDVGEVVSAEGEEARHELAAKLVALAAGAAGNEADPDCLAELCGHAIAESNKLLAERDGAVVSFRPRSRECSWLPVCSPTRARAMPTQLSPRRSGAAWRASSNWQASCATRAASRLTRSGPASSSARCWWTRMRSPAVGTTCSSPTTTHPCTTSGLGLPSSPLACCARPHCRFSIAPGGGDSELHRATELAVGLLSASPVKDAPICFEHPRAATNIRFEALELLSKWLDRALGFLADSERVGLIRDREDFAALRGLLAQALIGAWCCSES